MLSEKEVCVSGSKVVGVRVEVVSSFERFLDGIQVMSSRLDCGCC